MAIFSRIPTQPDCSICLSPFLLPGEKTYTACRHTFHQACLQKWLEKGDSCPICRHLLIKFVSFEQVSAAAKKWRTSQLSESEVKQLCKRFQKGIRIRTTEKRRIEKLRIEDIKKEYASLEQLDFRDDFSLIKRHLMKEKIENEARKRKSNKDFNCMLVFIVAFCIFIFLPNAHPKIKKVKHGYNDYIT